MKEKRYIYVHPSGEYLICTFDKPDKILEAPTFKEAMRITPNYIAYAEKGDTLIFRDMTIKIKDNPKHRLKDEELANALHDEGELKSAEDGFAEWNRILMKLDNGQRIRFLGMVFNDRFNAGKPVDVDDLLNY